VTKKNNNKKKVNVKLSAGQTLVVLNYEDAKHIADTYDFLSTEFQSHDDISYFLNLAADIRNQSVDNYFSNDNLEEEYYYD
jgi:hypothetical protein